MMSKAEKIANFDPNGIGARNGNLFGLPFDYADSQIVIIPVTWDVSVSYKDGTANAPAAILEASPQLDLYDPDVVDAWKNGICMLPISESQTILNRDLRAEAVAYIEALEKGQFEISNQADTLQRINTACENLKNEVKQQASRIIADGKIPAVLGGDHSTPLGLMEALAERHGTFGILQIDAHADLRDAYEGFTYSHASIMFNALRIPTMRRLVSVGVRDVSEAEVELAKEDARIKAFYDWEIKEKVHIKRTHTWARFCRKIVKHLPRKVYVSFDIDGLDPKLCAQTGTPVAGGLALHEAFYLLKTLVKSGRTIIGFDLCEVAPNTDTEWNANVGARVLYKLCNLCVESGKQ